MKKRISLKLTLPTYLMFIIVTILATLIGKEYFTNNIINSIYSDFDYSAQILNKATVNSLKELSEINEAIFEGDEFLNILQACDTLAHDTCSNLISQSLTHRTSLKNKYGISILSKEGEVLFTNKYDITRSTEFKDFLNNVVKKKKHVIADVIRYKDNFYIISVLPLISGNKIIGYSVLSEELIPVLNAFKKYDFAIASLNGSIIYKSKEVNDNVLEEILEKHKDNFKSGNYVYKSFKFYVNNKKIGYIIFYTDFFESFKDAWTFMLYLLIFAIVALVIGGYIYYLGIRETIVKPLRKIESRIKLLAEGELPDEIKTKKQDEIGEISKSLNQLINNFKAIVSFTKELGQGNYNVDSKEIKKMNKLGDALTDLKNNLKEAEILQKQKEHEDNIRHWEASGLAKFGDILRRYNDDEKKTFDEIIKNLVHYVGVEQGSLLILNDEDENDKYLEIVSTYAYDRYKFNEDKIPLGEGVAGEVALEGKSIYISDLPEDFANITSGLGEAKPKYLFVAPLKLEDEIYGVIELASFHEIEEYKRAFVEKLAENIASAMKNIKVNKKTKILLAQFQEQSEELRAQEEELKQNLEELQATQEDLMHKEKELNTITNAIENNLLKIELNGDGIIINANIVAEKLSGKTKDELTGKPLDEIVNTDLTSTWLNINKNQVKITTLSFGAGDEATEVKAAFIPFVSEGRLHKVLVIGIAGN